MSRFSLLLLALLAFLVVPACTAPGPSVRFGLITDIHYADRPNASNRSYGSALAKLDAFVAAMNAAKPDFVVELGDFKDQDPTPVKENTLRYLTIIESRFAAFEGPRYHVLGNHDLDSLSKAEFQARAVNTGIDPGATYYSFDQGGFHFVVLDGNFKADGTPYDSGNYTWQDANIPPQERTWLAADLAAHRLPTIVFVHQRLDLANTADANIKNGSEIRKILEDSHQVMAVFSGHDHPGAYKQINGIHYLTVYGTIEGGVDPVAGNGYAVATVSRIADGRYRLDVQGTGRQPSRIGLEGTASP
jgi:3',5'-cyclic AMP phosphodiesterase CpdA